jgi:prophage maintenance system killer protein
LRGETKMMNALKETPPVPSDEDTESLNMKPLEREVILQDIKDLMHRDPERVKDYIEHVENAIKKEQEHELFSIDKEELKCLIERHPFFKNPNNFHIRLITIMKYLEKKGIDININDIDILVDGIIQTIDGVKKIGYDKYTRKK